MTQNPGLAGHEQTSVVLACGATDCRYNELRECHAGQIEIGLSGDAAQCMTYDPSDDKRGAADQPFTTPS